MTAVRKNVHKTQLRYELLQQLWFWLKLWEYLSISVFLCDCFHCLRLFCGSICQIKIPGVAGFARSTTNQILMSNLELQLLCSKLGSDRDKWFWNIFDKLQYYWKIVQCNMHLTIFFKNPNEQPWTAAALQPWCWWQNRNHKLFSPFTFHRISSIIWYEFFDFWKYTGFVRKTLNTDIVYIITIIRQVIEYIEVLAHQLVFNYSTSSVQKKGKYHIFKVLLAAAYLDDACTGCHMDFQPTVEFDPHSTISLTLSRIFRNMLPLV